MGADAEKSNVQQLTSASGGYVAATVGALLGALVIGIAAGFITYYIGIQFDDPNQPCDEMMCFHGLGAFIGGVFAFFAGLWIGLGFGCWSALRICGHMNASSTVGVLQGVLVAITVTTFMTIPSIVAIDRELGINEHLGVDPMVPVGFALVAVLVVAPLVARYFTLKIWNSFGPNLLR